MLLDKSNLVRKATVQLLQEILTWNPFGENLPLPTLEKSLEENKQKLVGLLKELPAPAGKEGWFLLLLEHGSIKL